MPFFPFLFAFPIDYVFLLTQLLKSSPKHSLSKTNQPTHQPNVVTLAVVKNNIDICAGDSHNIVVPKHDDAATSNIVGAESGFEDA